MLHRTSALTVAALVSGVLLVSMPATAAGETCHGRPATIVGTGSNIEGTPGDDVIVTGGSQVTHAGAGDDLVCVSPFSYEYAYVSAGDGDDVVDVSTSTPRLSTRVSLGTGLDRYVGGPAYGEVSANGADDNVVGADLVTLKVTDPVTGPRGTYTRTGEVSEFGSDIRVSSADQGVEIDLAGHVVVAGVPAADIAGFSSASVVAPQAVVRGDAEDNFLRAAGCHVTVVGKGGDDYLDGNSGDGARKFECDEDQIKGSLGRSRLIGHAGNDELRGSSRADVLLGGSGHDDLSGGGGADVLRGNRGRDTLVGGPGWDVLLGNRGRDRADGERGRDACVAERERRCER